MLRIQDVQAEAGKVVYGRFVVGSVQIPLILAAGRREGPVLVIHCAQHRTEYGGSTAVPRFLRNLDLEALKGSVVILPLVDVPAITTTRIKDAYPEQVRDMAQYAGQERANINRVWPGNAAGSWVDRLAYALSNEIFKQATAVLDFHAARVVDDPFTAYSVEHGPSKEVALAFGTRTIDQDSTGHPPVGQLHKAIPLHFNVAAILVEAPCSSQIVYEPIVHQMHRGMVNVCRHLGMLAGAPELPEQQAIVRRPDPTHIFTAQHTGFFTWYLGPGCIVRKGDLVGEVRDLSTFQVLQECIAPFDGALPSIGPNTSQVVLPGEELATLKPIIESRTNR